MVPKDFCRVTTLRNDRARPQTETNVHRIFTACQRRCRKVMCSVLYVSFYSQWLSCDHYSWCFGPHHTGTPSPWPRPPDPRVPLYRVLTPPPIPGLPRHSLWSTYGRQAGDSHPAVMLSRYTHGGWMVVTKDFTSRSVTNYLQSLEMFVNVYVYKTYT